ncbi:SIR2 family NAD-dependent protein deacylase [Pseudomonas oryzihabitans]|uniref:SIR2 family NAD-dependent protein deacylase n=1 Tax=Pseudomonas oryzihabitans TaxID=47885 RepID=UPI0028569A31|nr:SIR2 family protein [Pseudomonas psychrotolerans]MDR6677806.1 hypothetical protein [Pseudomonas psychrotolerans]
MEKESAVHLESIKRALENGNAAVMVGAGFSKNAEGGDQLKLWNEVAKELWLALNPDSRDKEEFSSTLVTQLGDQYAQVFSLPALEDLLKRLIPDDKVKPGELHGRLLELPWSEIFTTNYDTLIERAAEETIGQSHYTVTCREDIPQSKILKRRRIVKLHGSFPSQRPFIFTEEQYRTYPSKFAPFVNLVRQSMLENIFCLIGFSGDDPNFLQWIGWVRDMLDQHSLPIYLFTGSPLSIGQRKLLEARKITPVLLPTGLEGEKTEYKERYRILFEALSGSIYKSNASWIEDLKLNNATTLEDNQNPDNLIENLESIFRLRDNYPGWLIAPKEVRSKLISKFRHSSFGFDDPEIYKKLLNRDPHICIAALAAYTWVQDKSLQPLNDLIAKTALDALKITTSLDEESVSAPDRSILKTLNSATSSGFLKIWKEVAIGVLRWAREEQERIIFGDLKTLIKASLPHNIDAYDEIIYETILYALYEGERDRARSDLYSWRPSSTDSYMEVRKGALLAELGDIDNGLRACVVGLQKLRRNQRINPDSPKLLSEESWAGLIIKNIRLVESSLQSRARYSSTNLQQSNQSENKHNQPNSDYLSIPIKTQGPDKSENTRIIEKIEIRLSELENRGFKAEREQDSILSQLDTEIAFPIPSTQVIQQFDLGSAKTTYRIGGFPSELRGKIESGFALLTQMDRTAVPPRIGNFTFYLTAYTQAAWWIQYIDSTERVISVAIRTLNKEVLDERDNSMPPHRTGWLSRTRVGCLPEHTSLQLCKKSISLIESSLPKLKKEKREFDSLSDLSKEAIKFNIAILSKSCIRITDYEFIDSLTRKIITLLGSEELWSQPELWNLFSVALSRCLEACPPQSRSKFYPAIFDLPIYPNDHTQDSRYFTDWINTYEILKPTDSIKSNLEEKLVAHSLSLINTLIEKEDYGSPYKTIVWARLFTLEHLGQVSETAKEQISELLWSDSGNWPNIPGHNKFSALMWITEKTRGNLTKAFKNLEIKRITSLDNPNNPGNPSWALPIRDDELQCFSYCAEQSLLSDELAIAGLSKIKEWWDSEWLYLSERHFENDDINRAIVSRLNKIDKYLSLSLPKFWEKLLSEDEKKWLETIQAEANPFEFKFWRLSLRIASDTQNRGAANEIDMELATKLLGDSSKEKLNTSVLIAADWIRSNWKFRPSLTIDTAISIIKARHSSNLNWCLHLIRLCVKKDRRAITPKRFKSIETGLSILKKDLNYDGKELQKLSPDEDIPLARYNCTNLALSLAKIPAYKDSLELAKWIDDIENDPLPEVRFLKNNDHMSD